MDAVCKRLRTVFGWMAVGFGLYLAVVLPWDQLGGGRIRRAVKAWRGWKDLKSWSASRLRKAADDLEPKPPEKQKSKRPSTRWSGERLSDEDVRARSGGRGFDRSTGSRVKKPAKPRPRERSGFR